MHACVQTRRHLDTHTYSFLAAILSLIAALAMSFVDQARAVKYIPASESERRIALALAWLSSLLMGGGRAVRKLPALK